MTKLTFKDGDKLGRKVEVPADGLVIGRNDSCNLKLDDPLAAGQHAELYMENGHWWISDLTTANGTKVNEQTITASRLNNGDVITIGHTTLVFQVDGKAAPVAEVKAAAPVHKTSGLTAGLDDIQVVKELNAAYKRMTDQISRVIVGQEEVVEQVLISIFCRGHCLLIGVPGVAKTLLVSTLSKALDLSFKRIQFTPDLMPSDITGTDVLEEDRTTGGRVFRFIRGPIFANMVLADEINRTPPKTQAALLEAMQEHRATIGDKTYHLPEPFFVLATQNPIEQEGTYPLPEAQLDRFFFNILVKYPTAEQESAIIKQVTGTYKVDLEVALTGEDILRLQQVVRHVPAADHVVNYARDLARATRPKEVEAPDFVKELVSWGAGPRAGISLMTAAKARAILKGRFHATTEDVRAVALPVLRHRVITTFNAEAAGITSDDVVRKLLDKMKPVEESAL